MSNAKKLPISYPRLIEIAEILNENLIKNRERSKENKIPTDKFIRKRFNISRKDFSFTIKDTDIKYNPSTFLYDIPDLKDIELSESNENLSKVKEVNKNNTEVNQENYEERKIRNIDSKDIIHIDEKKVHQSMKEVYLNNEHIDSNVSVPEEFKDLILLKSELKEMLKWWRKQTNPDIVEVQIPKINLENPKLRGDVVTKSYKVYEKVAEDFSDFAKNKKETTKETIKDLVSLALVEFMEKYK